MHTTKKLAAAASLLLSAAYGCQHERDTSEENASEVIELDEEQTIASLLNAEVDDGYGAVEDPLDEDVLSDEATETSPVVAELLLDGEVEVTFVAVSDDAIGIGVGGPSENPLVDEVAALIPNAESPADLYNMLSPDSSPPDELQALSNAVLAADNWKTVEESSVGLAGADNASSQSDSDSPLRLQAHPRTVSSDPCTNLTSSGDLAGNWGNCNLYTVSYPSRTSWEVNDITGFSGHVIVEQGYTRWTVDHRNCNTGCSWTNDYDKTIIYGHHYYYYMYDENDDFRARSRGQALTSITKHHHDIARIHDWFHRTVHTSSSDSYDSIRYNGSTLYGTCAEYRGPDPSNISGGWNPSAGGCS